MAYSTELLAQKGYTQRIESSYLYQVMNKAGISLEDLAIEIFGSNDPVKNEKGNVVLENGAVKDNALMVQNIMLDRDYNKDVLSKLEDALRRKGISEEDIDKISFQIEKERITKNTRDDKYDKLVKDQLVKAWFVADTERSKEVADNRAKLEEEYALYKNAEAAKEAASSDKKKKVTKFSSNLLKKVATGVVSSEAPTDEVNPFGMK